MEAQLRNCILIAILLLLVSVIFYTLKKLVMFAIIIIVALLFFARSGILYMASNYEPPKLEIPIETEIDLDAPEIDFELPSVEYKDSGARGFGLDVLDKISD